MKRVLFWLFIALLLCGAARCHAAVYTCVTRVALNTSTGNQAITCSGLNGAVTKAAELIVTAATADNTAVNGAMLGRGFTDCTNQATIGSRAQDLAAGSTNTDEWATTTGLLNGPDLSANSLDLAATITSCDAGGITINISNAPASAYFVHVFFWAGNEVTAAAGGFTTNASIGSTTTVTPNFQTQLLLMAGTNGANDNSNNPSYLITHGAVTYDGATITQRAIGWTADNGVATSSMEAGMTATYGTQLCNVSTCSTARLACDITSITSTQFVCTTRNQALAAGIIYLALNLGTRRVNLQTVTTPTSNSTISLTAGWRPQAALYVQTGVATIDTAETDGDAGYFGMAMMVGSTAYMVSQAMEDATATGSADAQSLSDDVAINLPGQAGATLFTGSHSFTATGTDLTFTAEDGTARKGFLVQIESNPPARRRQLWFN